ncbi:hypothetical protein M501DRAFT_972771 [Patellaria atrata CBS 101060]|uniref:Uncharacterized protein n=1 Tax=Patellaria atrata CBS 101060 TaxID=1346257 RepID=A0A9P4SF53_9PEZI|nr:hypothetical protein M501DRAFT_972771 [Patellaria atrata CBS 101060]
MYALYTLLSLLPLSAYAIDGRPNGPPAKPAPTVPETFHWTNPWGEDVSPPIDLEPACDVIATYKLNQHLLYDVPIMPPLGFQPYAKHMKAFFGSAEYPGGWEGLDPHGSDRVLLAMNWTDVPNAVKEWVLENEAGGRKGRGLYSVYKRATGFEEEPDILPAHGVWEHDLFMVFSPGAIYEIAPLWVANERCVPGSLSV